MKNENIENVNAGNVTVSEGVIATVVRDAVTQLEGVKGIHGTEEIKKFGFLKLKGQNENGGIRVSVKNGNEASVEIPVVLSYGSNVVDISRSIQECAVEAIESLIGLKAGDIDVIVEQIAE